MTLTIAILLLLLVATIYVIGSFMPQSTTMRIIAVEQNIDQCFAAVNETQRFAEAIKYIRALSTSSSSIFEVGSTGKINLEGSEKPFEVVAFVPNYRIAAEHRNGAEIYTVQLSFYRLSRRSTRLVVITQIESPSPVRRFKNAITAKKRAARIDEMLEDAKVFFEGLNDDLETVSDVTPEENPNFSLR